MESQAVASLVTDDEPFELPDQVADAWAAVLIDVYEKQQRHANQEPQTSDGSPPPSD